MEGSGTAALDAILDGIEAALELERELGCHVFECDRSLLSAPEIRKPARSVPSSGRRAEETPPRKTVQPPATAPGAAGAGAFDFVFLHHRALNAAGAEMIEKIAEAMKKLHHGIAGGSVHIDPPLPPARVYVVLGSFALKKFFPALRGAPGQWLKTEDGADVLVSNSPEYILRFGVETEAVKKIKQDMWRSLKTVVQRLAS